MSVEVSQVQDYRKSVKSHSQYKFSRIISEQGPGSNSNGWVSTSGGNDAVFEIPQVPINLSQSVLQLQLTPTAAGASCYNWVFMDSLSFLQGIQLYTRQGVMLCDISNNLQNYTKVVWKADVRRDEYENFDLVATSSGAGRMLRKSNGAASSTPATCTLRPTKSDANSTAENVPYLENQYVQPGAITTATPIINVSIPLSMIKNTIFEIDKTLYFDQVVLCRLIFGANSKCVYVNHSATDPSDTTGLAIAPGAVSVSNMYLYLAQERNPELANVLRAEIQKGSFSIPIPYVHIFKQGAITGTSQSTTVRLNRAHGRRLLKIYHSMFGGSADGNLQNLNFAYCNAIGNHNTNNLNYMESYHTELQTQRLQSWEITLSSYDDWLVQQQRLQNSLVLSSEILRYNFFHLDDFTGSEKSVNKDYIEKNQMVGVPLDVEQRYDWFSTHHTTAAPKKLDHFDMVVVQKLLQITPQGIMCD